MDIKAWRSIMTGWTPPMVTDSEGKKVLKPEIDWSTEDDRLVNYNNKAYDPDHIKLISSCETTKKA